MFPDSGNGKGSETSTSTAGLLQRCCQFEFDEILLATENFNESLVVGKGSFGKVYKGNISIGTTQVDVAIKRLDLMSNQGETEFRAEVEMLSKLRHFHLVSLIGYCYYEKETILVYEYMPHGTLEDHLHKLHTPLSWLERLKICLGAARGLDYLHTGIDIEVGVIHRDVKSSNILLHESWAAKISYFGLARIGPTNQPSTYVNTLVKGTFGYIDPNYFATGKLTRKSDVYSFGVVLFEVLCQKRPLDESFECGLVKWIQESIKEGNLKQIVYSGIRSEISPKSLKGFARIAEKCLENNPKRRPTMTEVVFNLESLLAQSVLSSQQKTNNWLQTPGKKVFGRISDVFPFSSPGENLGISISPDDNSGTPISRGESSGMSKEADWEVDEIIILKEDYDLTQLPDSPRCKNLLKLSIQLSGLTEIPPTFFEHMPLLEELDLSTTNIQSLPSSISSLTSLQKLFLRDCSVLMELPSEIRMLTKLKLLDCEGSEIMYIPKEIGELNDLEVLRVSLSLHADYFLKTKPVNDSVKIPRNILSKLTKLKELCITTCPEAEWWEEEVKEIQDDLCHLEYLETLKWYLPTKMMLDRFLQIKREGKRTYENLSNFTLTIGRHPQLTSCLPANLQKKFENFEKCLKWINAEGNEKDISMILPRTEALFLSRHWTIVRLSDFFDLGKLKYCLLAECNEMKTLVEVDELSEGVESIGTVGFESIEYLTVHDMEKFQSIWKGPMGKDSLSRLRILALHTCPNLTTIFTINIAQNLSRLTELTIEDCPKVTSLISNESPNIATGPLFPCLEKIFLLDLPELESIFRGKIILEEVDSLLVYNCLKLQNLSVTELPNIQKINGEKEWWNDLKCDKSRWQNIFEQLKAERHLIEQLAEATNSLQHFHDILSRDAKGKKPLDRSSLRVSEAKGQSSNFPIGEQEAAKDEKLLGGSALGVSEIKSDISNFPLEEQQGVSLSQEGVSHSRPGYKEPDLSGSSTPIVSNGSSSFVNRSSGQNKARQSEATARNGSRSKDGDSRGEDEWVEQDEPGVYITLTSLPGGIKDLKRVRFSRKRFNEKQAEQWWAENRARVYQRYNVRLVDKSSIGVASDDLPQ